MTTWHYATFDGNSSEEELSFQEEKLRRASRRLKKPVVATPPATSQYSSSRNAAVNLARKQRRDSQRATSSRDPEPRSLSINAALPLPLKTATTSAGSALLAQQRNGGITKGIALPPHLSSYMPTSSPSLAVQPPMAPSAAAESKALSDHAVAALRSAPTVPAPQPPSLVPEVNTMEKGRVRGTTDWLQKHAPVRRLANAKSEQIVEVRVLAPGTKDHWIWVAAVLEADHGGRGRSYVLLESDEWHGDWKSEGHENDEKGGDGNEDEQNTSAEKSEGEGVGLEGNEDKGSGGGSESDDGNAAASAASTSNSSSTGTGAPIHMIPPVLPPKSVLIARHEQRSRVRRVGSEGAVFARARCYMCGRECGIASLPFHHQKCLLKWDARVALPSRFTCELTDPRGLPTGPGPDLDAYNARALEVYETTVKPKCPGCLLPFTPSSLISHAKECLKPRPRLLAQVLATFGPDGYEPLGAKLVGGKRCKPKHLQTIAGPGTVMMTGSRNSSSRGTAAAAAAASDKRAPRLGHSGVMVGSTSTSRTGNSGSAAASAAIKLVQVQRDGDGGSGESQYDDREDHAKVTSSSPLAASSHFRPHTISTLTFREQSSSRLTTWNGSGDYRERPLVQQATAFGQLFRPKQRPTRQRQDDGASKEFWEFTAESGGALQ